MILYVYLFIDIFLLKYYCIDGMKNTDNFLFSAVVVVGPPPGRVKEVHVRVYKPGGRALFHWEP